METIKNRKTIFLFAVLALAGIGFTAFLNINSKSNLGSDNGISGIYVDNGDTKVNWSKYPTFNIDLNDSLEIKESGTYNLSGDLNDDSITVDVGDESGVVKLVLDNVYIDCSDGPAIYVKSADDVVIETVKDTKNYLSSGETYRDFGEDNVDATIYSKGDLSFSGDGYLYIESNYQDAIVSKDDLTIRSGEIEVSAADDGIRGKDSVNISGGKVVVAAEQDGIKSTNEDDKTKGFVYIQDGEIEISASDDGIHATSSFIIDGGKIDIKKSYEGLEGGKVIVNGGKISVYSNDDGVNVAGGNDESAFMRPGAQNFSEKIEYVLTVNDGDIYINASGDGLDSNGNIYINGGNIVVDGPINSANGALDSEMGIYFNGGSVIAVGASGMAETFNDSSVAFGASIYLSSSQAKGTKISIKDESGEEILSHTSAKSFNHVAIGSEKFEFGKTYTIYIDDEEYESFTVASTVTTVGTAPSGMNGGMMGPGGQNMQDGQHATRNAK